MRGILALICIALSLTACGRAEKFSAPGSQRILPLETKVIDEPKRTLAYEHEVGLEVPSEKISATFAAVQAKCAELTARQCEVLDSHIESGRMPNAHLKLRAAPKSIQDILASLGALGTVATQSTKAQDLAGPIADAQNTLALKKDYRARLEALLPKASADVDALIKINRELAQVQAEIESATGQSAFLEKRVNTELLTIVISSPHITGSWASLSDTPDEIARNLANGTAAAIATLAFLAPWALLLLALVKLFKWFRRYRRGRKVST
jgi:hypothetical protein